MIQSLTKLADIAISSLLGVGGIGLASVSIHFLTKKGELSAADEYIMDGLEADKWFFRKDFDEGYLTLDEYNHKMDLLTKRVKEINSKYSPGTATVILSSIGIVVGLAMIGFSIYSIVQIVDKYNPKYTKIPSNMIDTVETANGNRFINYTVVNSLYKDGDKTAEKPGDTNGYGGNEWNAIYYTKSYEAGKCMTSTGYFIDSASNFGKYTPVAKFGANNCYDLNSFNRNDSTENIFVAFGNSNNKKTAETSVPTVVGSAFTYGAIAISGVTGLGLGMCIMSVIKRKKEN